jgi:hypothetical protein
MTTMFLTPVGAKETPACRYDNNVYDSSRCERNARLTKSIFRNSTTPFHPPINVDVAHCTTDAKTGVFVRTTAMFSRNPTLHLGGVEGDKVE